MNHQPEPRRDVVPPSSRPDPALADATQRIVLTHVVLAALTPLIPVPFVDDYVKARVQRRMVQKLATVHGVDLTPAAVAILADDPSATWSGRLTGLALLPMRAVFRKTFLILGIKGLVDGASITWHRAFLINYALASGWCTPAGSAANVRAAIDAVCEEVPVTPLKPALRAAFEGSESAVRRISEEFARRFGRAGSTEGAVDRAIDEAAGTEEQVASGIVDRLRRGIADVPEAHFERLRTALARRLGAAPR